MYKATIFNSEEDLIQAIEALKSMLDPPGNIPYVIALTEPTKESAKWRIVDTEERGFPLDGDFTLGHPDVSGVIEFITHLLPGDVSYEEVLEMGILPLNPINLLQWKPSNKED